MKIRLLSDLHEEFATRVGGPLTFEPMAVDVTILAGDIGNGVGALEVALRPCFANTTVILVLGNHEYYGGVVPEGMMDYELIETEPGIKLTAADTVQMHSQARQFIEQVVRAKPTGSQCVVVSHHAPHPLSIASRFTGNTINPAFVSDLTGLMQGVDLWVHGHTHDGFDYSVNGTRVVANPAGYRKKRGNEWTFENANFAQSMLIML